MTGKEDEDRTAADRSHEARVVSMKDEQKFLHSQNETEARSPIEIPENSQPGARVFGAEKDEEGTLSAQTTQVIGGESSTSSAYRYNEKTGKFNVDKDLSTRNRI